MGADDAVRSSDEAEMAKYMRSQHMILDTVSAKHDVNTYLNLLRMDGTVMLIDKIKVIAERNNQGTAGNLYDADHKTVDTTI